jgi:hypothetical protein
VTPAEAVEEEAVAVEEPAETVEPEAVEEIVEAPVEEVEETVASEAEAEIEEQVAEEPTAVDSEPEEPVEDKRPGFSKIFDALTGFHGTSVRAEPKLPELPVADEEEAPLELDAQFEPAPGIVPEPEAHAERKPTSVEGPLQTKLEEVRAKADEARLAKLRSNIALYEGLGAAYDFALDAEGAP